MLKHDANKDPKPLSSVPESQIQCPKHSTLNYPYSLTQPKLFKPSPETSEDTPNPQPSYHRREIGNALPGVGSRV